MKKYTIGERDCDVQSPAIVFSAGGTNALATTVLSLLLMPFHVPGQQRTILGDSRQLTERHSTSRLCAQGSHASHEA